MCPFFNPFYCRDKLQEFQMFLCFFESGIVANKMLTRWNSAAPHIWLTLSLCVFIGSMNNILPQVEPQLEESPGERRGSRAYQVESIFSSVVGVSCFPFLSWSFTGTVALELLTCFSQAVVATATCNMKRLRAAEQQSSFSIYMNKALRWPTCSQL